MARIPTVTSVMTPFPYSVDAMESVRTAAAMMEQHGIHHLPVTRDRKIVGIISQRDILTADAVLGQRGEVEVEVEVPVWSICTRDPYIVEVDTRIDVVADEIANHHVGSALVTKKGRLAGIITTTDLCRAYADLLRDNASSPDDDVA